MRCGKRHYWRDDWSAIRLTPELIAPPPIVLQPQVVARVPSYFSLHPTRVSLPANS
jgi:hypothetical protein